MIKIFLILLYSHLFVSDITLFKLDNTEHNVTELKKYDLLVFYTPPLCSSCVKELNTLIKKHNVYKTAVIARSQIRDKKHQGFFLANKFLQQEIKKTFNIGMEDIFFDISKKGVFSIIGDDSINSDIDELTPAILIIQNSIPIKYYSHSDLYNDDAYSGLHNAFGKHFPISNLEP